MREVVLTVPRVAVEPVLDRLLPIVPGGVREVPRGRQVELRMRGAEVPGTGEIKAAVGKWPHKLSERVVSDDWRERRLADYAPEIIGGRLLVRPEWAPPAARGLIEIELSDSDAFGVGTHPTTRACLELVLEIAPQGSFADLGCGSGVLAILAARLGWAPVLAVDVRPESVEAAARNAACNGAAVEVTAADLSTQSPPAVDGFAANVPAALHEAIAGDWAEPVPRVGLLSGFGPDEAVRVSEAYAARGLRERRRLERAGWVVAVIERD